VEGDQFESDSYERGLSRTHKDPSQNSASERDYPTDISGISGGFLCQGCGSRPIVEMEEEVDGPRSLIKSRKIGAELMPYRLLQILTGVWKSAKN
jgi:hypothetical protein